MPRPLLGSFPAYFETYVKLVEQDSVEAAFEAQQPLIDNFFDALPADKHNYAYAPGKWTLKELLQHIIDTERVFQYRALSFARGEKQSLPGFDENAYAEASAGANRSWEDLCLELKAVRLSSVLLFRSLSENMLNNTGLTSGYPCNANAIGFIQVGHIEHHRRIIEERYLA